MSLSEHSLLDFIRSSPKPLTKRELAQAFHIKGGENRVALKQILKRLEKSGQIIKQAGGAYAVPDGLPEVTIIEVTDIDIDGDEFAKAVDWNEELQGKPPRIEVMPGKKGHPPLKVGDRVLARMQRVAKHVYAAHPIKRLDDERGRVMGILRMTDKGPVLQPTDKKAKYDYPISPGDEGDAKDGDLCIAEIQPARNLKHKKVRVTEVLGEQGDPKAISLISLHEVGLRHEFPKGVIESTKNMKVPELGKREDLRTIPLITIDGADARDFDDAVYAEKTKMPDGSDGFHLIVAIADVSHYVTPESPLDIEAQARGNSTYFPDRVLPMLPEALSNDLCSLRPNEPRAALAMHMWIDRDGRLVKHKIVRALIRSYARCIYEQVQAMHDQGEYVAGDGTDLSSVIPPLYEAYAVLDAARQQRGALDLDLPEKQIIINDKNEMTGVKVRTRLDAHKLIEEFMILANVAAAQCLEAKRAPCVYRIHDKPSQDKLNSVREFIESFELSLPRGQNVQSRQLNGLLRQAAKLPFSHLISQVILRSQSQAVYSTDNVGHFGLALSRYAHFTSPIRRYADLLVHRSLVRAYGLGGGGLSDGEEARLEEICQHISQTERSSMEAERNAVDRFTAAYLSTQIGAEFAGRISGVTRFGLFVTLHESNADGLVPMKSLDDDFYVHDEEAHALVGKRKGKVFRLGGEVNVILTEADGLTGSTVLNLSKESLKLGADIPGMKKPRSSGSAKNFRGGRGGGKGGPKKGGKNRKRDRKGGKGPKRSA